MIFAKLFIFIVLLESNGVSSGTEKDSNYHKLVIDCLFSFKEVNKCRIVVLWEESTMKDMAP